MAIFREVVRGAGDGVAEYYRIIDGSIVNVDYDVTINKPTINGKELIGDLNLTQLMIDEGFLREETDPTVPEYIKIIKIDDINKWQQSVNADYVNDAIATAIGSISQFGLIPVDELPTEDIRTNAIYAVPSASSKVQNARDEYVYINGDWECIGTTLVDLSNYYTKEEIDIKLQSIAGGLGGINEELEIIINGGE